MTHHPFVAAIVAAGALLTFPTGASADVIREAPTTFKAIVPTRRLVDTRDSGTRLAVGQTLRIRVPEAAATDRYSSVIANVTVTESTSAGYVTARPCNVQSDHVTARFAAGQTTATQTHIGADYTGQVCFQTTAATHLIVDVVGVYNSAGISPTGFARAGRFEPVTPVRVVDSRETGGVYRHWETRSIPVEPTLKGASIKAALVLNLTAVNPTANGFVRVWPSGTPEPAGSNLNLVVGRTASNQVIVPAGADGRIMIRTHLDGNPAATVSLIVDLTGFMTSVDNASSDFGLWVVNMVPITYPIATPMQSLVPVRVGLALDQHERFSAMAGTLDVVGGPIESYFSVFPFGGIPPVVSNTNPLAGEARTSTLTVGVSADLAVAVVSNIGSGSGSVVRTGTYQR